MLSTTKHGAIFTDIRKTTVDGHPATELTTTGNGKENLDGLFGCEKVVEDKGDCVGMGGDLNLRMVIVAVDGKTLQIWLRTGHEVIGDEQATDFKAFDHEVASVDSCDEPLWACSYRDP